MTKTTLLPISGPFAGRTVVVTGAGSNLGRSLAQRFHAAGAHVALCDLDAATCAAITAELTAKEGGGVLGMACDIANEKAVCLFFAAVKRAFGGIDALVNNAAHLGVDQPAKLLDQTTAGFAHVIAVNLVGTFTCCREGARLMRDGGAIINVGSNTSVRAIRGRPAYIASKGGISGLTRALALDLAPRIRVNEVAPGFILTPRWDGIGTRARRIRRSLIPLGEPATTDAIAEAILFLTGDGARAITGARLVADGGCDVQLMPPALQV